MAALSQCLLVYWRLYLPASPVRCTLVELACGARRVLVDWFTAFALFSGRYRVCITESLLQSLFYRQHAAPFEWEPVGVESKLTTQTH